MRAWQIVRHGEPEVALRRVDTPLPDPGPGEVRIRVEAAALGLPDVFMARGSYAFKPALPATPGQEVAGVITAVGEGGSLSVGTRVMAVTAFFRGFGGLAEEALALEASSYPAPAEMDAAEAASFVIPYHTAHLGLVTRGRLQQGETLLVLGAAGGTGAAAIQLGRALGARVIAVAGGTAKVAACLKLGAAVAIDHSECDLAQAVNRETDGRGADLIYDPVGGEAFEAGLRCIASEGRLLAIGYASGVWSDASTSLLVGKNAAVVGVFVGAYAKPFLSEVHEELLARWRAGEIGSLVSREVGFDDIAAALTELAERRTIGKVVARMESATR
jgi:NADPH2:quinone reductase